jgi:hypothetical protein
MVSVVGIVTNVVDVDLDQAPLSSALKNTGLKIRRENFRQEGENLELHC